MNIEEIKERIKGVLIGCAYGDAMGMPTEMMTREMIDELFPNGVHHFEPSTKKDVFKRNFPAGTVTDDTINTLLVCDVLIENKGIFNTHSYIHKLQKWIQENEEIKQMIIGPSTQRAIEAIENGVPIEEAGKRGTTNGAAMKVSPIGILYDYRNLDQLINQVEQLCKPTHNTEIAITGAAIIAACVSYAIRGGNELEELWELANQVIQAAKGSGHSQHLPHVSLKARLDAVHTMVQEKDTNACLHELETFYGTGLETIETIPAVLTIVTLAKGDPVQAAILAANLSGDSDTIGAISTAICGAMNPRFPEKDIALLENRNHLNVDHYANELATAFYLLELKA